MAAERGWLREFDEPIEAPDGTRLNTLRGAVAYLAQTVPKSERDMPAVTTAAEMLTYAAERGIAWMFFGAHGDTESDPPARCARVQSRCQRTSLGQAEAKARPMKRTAPALGVS